LSGTGFTASVFGLKYRWAQHPRVFCEAGNFLNVRSSKTPSGSALAFYFKSQI
jgi:hypothetical protein